MQARSRENRRERRGIVLVLVLGVLALMALIGITFATLSGQSRISARNFAQSVNQPQRSDLMDFALAQLIGDTDDIRSAIRGHSMARDMYGNDAANNGYLTSRPGGGNVPPYNNSLFYILAVHQVGTSNLYDVLTNMVLNDPALYGYDFTRWVLRLGYVGLVATGTPKPVDQTFEVVLDDYANVLGSVVADNTHRVLRVSAVDSTTSLNNPTLAVLANKATWNSPPAQPPSLNQYYPFILDGRYLRAFNGPGLGLLGANANFQKNAAALGQSTVPNSPGDPNVVGMDEDYDAVDLENWFLAMQSADGQVIIPSFHRPGTLRYDFTVTPPVGDWTNAYPDSATRILRPRKIDNPSFAASFPDPIPSTASGQITYDVDNDGDGITDSVWVDLGYPARRNDRGQLYKPLFAFMVIGLNGRMPLNTVGNRAKTGDSHASHLGDSPSEIDPTYALQNAFDPNGLIYSQTDNSIPPVDVRLTQLRNLLMGTRPPDNPKNASASANGDYNIVLVDGNRYWLPNGQYDATVSAGLPDQLLGVDPYTGNPAVARNTQPVAGRWGEQDLVPGILTTTAPAYSSRVRAGLSRADKPGAAGFPRDADDDNNNVFDSYPLRIPSASPPQIGETQDQDLYDASGGLVLPVERLRRFVTPQDINGTGQVVNFNAGSPGYGAANRGGDQWGRVSYFSYFRPPGLPGIMDVNPSSPTVGSIGYLASVPTTQRAPGSAAVDLTNNPLHAFDFFRFPVATNPQLQGGMPFDMNAGMTTPTYDMVVAGSSHPPSDGLDEADEMNLYQPNGLDAPFGPADLEWLYRQQDVDGSELSSRLEFLAPISFSDKANVQGQGDGLRRRRLFSLDAWDTNRFVWANDNPTNVFPNNFTYNSRFVVPSNTDFANLNVAVTDITALGNQTYPWYMFLGPILDGQPVPVSPTNIGGFPNDPVPHWPVPSPSVSHRERRINLNFPLPVSNDPNELVRHKWISETYQFLKSILPPLAVDTPEELAQLSQYVVNIVDFRDPDGTMTRFVNPDVIVVFGTVTGNPATSVTPTKLDYTANSGSYGANTWMPLEQFGVEYDPIAINEVLAFSFQRMGGTPPNATQIPTNRFFIELVNTLTQAAVGTSASLDLGNWDIVITGDDPVSRPDPFTGQLLPIQSANYLAQIPLSSVAFQGGSPTDVVMTPMATAGPPPSGYYYVIGNANPNSEQAPPTVTQTLADAFDPTSPTAPPPGPPTTLAPGFYANNTTSPLVAPGQIGNPNNTYPTAKIPQIPLGKAATYWICLRRPANPFQTPDPTNTVANPMVVVDCMRFTQVEGGGEGDNNGNVTTAPTNLLFSTQRTQPYRGGHAVSPTLGGTNLDTRYGFSEQTAVPAGNPTDYGLYNGNRITGPGTNNIYHTLGQANNQADPAWDYLPLHDRDFTSVAELLLVPGCPPGLFTKQFAEVAPSNGPPFNPPNVPPTNPPTPPTALPVAGTNAAVLFAAVPNQPHTFPYLVEQFFYTGASPPAGGPPLYGDQTGAGWFKMFEFFEVPSQAIGSTSSIASGANFDWMRQDTRPGQLNLNLIMDEEVLLGLLGQQDNSFNQQLLNFVPMAFDSPQNVPLLPTQLPRVVTGVNAAGTPVTSYEVGHNGHTYLPNGLSAPLVKAAFAQFLKIRHGGSGFMFAYGTGPTGTPNNTSLPPNLSVAAERPFRSLSFPDINYTVMRPAALPPSPFTLPPLNTTWTYTPPYTYAFDPGVMNPNLYPGYAPGTPPTGATPPAIPARRLFQIPDNYSGGSPPPPLASNASETGDPSVNIQAAPTGTPTTGSMGALSNNVVNVVWPPTVIPAPPANPYLGGAAATDGGQQPHYRTEMLQRVLNLTTVRTHQYAVWITIGFFEVTRQGDPSQALANPGLAYDLLGAEVGLLNGAKTRYRGFFIVDRLKLKGFDPSSPGNYRDAVIYRQTIE